jgi:ATP-dependent DNA ligase
MTLGNMRANGRADSRRSVRAIGAHRKAQNAHSKGDGAEMFKAICKLGLEGIVSKKLDAPYKSGPSKAWLKVKNPKASAATRAIDGTF